MKNICKLRYSLYLFGSLLLPTAGFAEDCDNLNTDKVWMEKIQNMKAAVDEQQWDAALEVGRDLYLMCSQSPILNYYIGISLQGKGEHVKSMKHLIAASENASKFATPAETSRKIYFTLYEAEHPDRTEEAVKKLNEQIDMLGQSNQTNADEYQKQEELIFNQNELHSADIKTAMWTGAGIGITGLVFTIVGGTLAFMDSSHIEGHEFKLTDNGDASVKENVKPMYSAGVAMLGAGLALSVAGAVVTGIFGYKYTHFDDHSISLSVSPEQISFGMTF